MTRKWATAKCSDCHKVPYRDPDGSGKLVSDVALLTKYGFKEATEVQGDIYYVGPLGHIVHLFPEDTWHSDKVAEGSNLEEYLNWVSGGQLK